jgi:hypothetical protein
MTVERLGCGLVAVAALALGFVVASTPEALGAADGNGERLLPAGTLRGPFHRMRQYPVLALATREQRAAALRLRAEVRIAVRRWRTLRLAAAAGYDVRRPPRRPDYDAVRWFHADHRRGFHSDGVQVDPSAPETLVYADVPRRPLVLVAVMFTVPRGVRGPTPGGPITRWHRHLVCIRRNGPGLTPGPNNTCPRGHKLRLGAEQLHVWLTRDLRSAYAIGAPVHELCVARLLPPGRCHHTGHGH